MLVLEKNKLPKGWERIPLPEIAEINPRFLKNSINDNKEVSFVPMKCVHELDGKIDLSYVRKFREVSKGYTYFEENDIIFAKITPCMENGKLAIAKDLKNKIGFGSTEFHVIRLLDKEIPRKFYFWFLLQDDYRKKAQRKMKGTAGQLRVPTSYLEQTVVPVPPLKEQKRIVSKVDELFSKIDASEIYLKEMLGLIGAKASKKNNSKLEKTINMFNTLRQSILKKAFEGKLVPQDLNDEPASELLKKIKITLKN